MRFFHSHFRFVFVFSMTILFLGGALFFFRASSTAAQSGSASVGQWCFFGACISEWSNKLTSFAASDYADTDKDGIRDYRDSCKQSKGQGTLEGCPAPTFRYFGFGQAGSNQKFAVVGLNQKTTVYLGVDFPATLADSDKNKYVFTLSVTPQIKVPNNFINQTNATIQNNTFTTNSASRMHTSFDIETSAPGDVDILVQITLPGITVSDRVLLQTDQDGDGFVDDVRVGSGVQQLESSVARDSCQNHFSRDSGGCPLPLVKGVEHLTSPYTTFDKVICQGTQYNKSAEFTVYNYKYFKVIDATNNLILNEKTCEQDVCNTSTDEASFYRQAYAVSTLETFGLLGPPPKRLRAIATSKSGETYEITGLCDYADRYTDQPLWWRDDALKQGDCNNDFYYQFSCPGNQNFTCYDFSSAICRDEKICLIPPNTWFSARHITCYDHNP